MSSQISDQQLSEAILQSVQYGVFPDSEPVSASELSSTSLQYIIKDLKKAQDAVKDDIRGLSRDVEPDINDWISQARKLHEDIKSSQTRADEIACKYDHLKHLRNEIQDVTNKISLLQGEIAFTKTVQSSLLLLQELYEQINALNRFVCGQNIHDAVHTLLRLEDSLSALFPFENTWAADALVSKTSSLRKRLEHDLAKYWDGLICVSVPAKEIVVKQRLELSSPFNLVDVSEALAALNLLNDHALSFSESLGDMILARMVASPDVGLTAIEIQNDTLKFRGVCTDESLLCLIKDLKSIVEFLCSNMPPLVIGPVSEKILPLIIDKLNNNWLFSQIPTELDGILQFDEVIDEITSFADFLNVSRWPGKMDLVDWIERLPQTWLNKRREVVLDNVRRLVSDGVEEFRTVEWVETQTVSSKDEVFPANSGGTEEWDAEWDVEESAEKKTVNSNKPEETSTGDDDFSAWGIEEGAESQDVAHEPADQPQNEEDIEIESWGWGDELEGQEAPAEPKSKDSNNKTKATEREVTLKETYTISSLPDKILEIIRKQADDSRALSERYSTCKVASASVGLARVIPFILAMFKAVSPTFYELNESGRMYLYNDCIWLAEQLRSFDHGRHQQLTLESDTSALEKFGKLSYSREMETQRTILSDLLDGAQGFSNCTQSPFSAACETAISSIVDRVKQIHAQWKLVLSRSALLQTTGSLLSTVVSKVIVDIEDMTDISEPESQRLSDFCKKISELNALFLPEKESSVGKDAAVPLTAGYVSNWLKFGYLAFILESPLAEIKSFWTEGYLKNEFTQEELIDLIRALFAESEHRRRAIREIQS